MKILISGGHLTPALAVIDYLQSEHQDDQIFFAGRLYSQEKTGQLAAEKAACEKRQVPFFELVAPKIATGSWQNYLFFGWHFLASLKQAWQIISEVKPDVFLSFGSYLAVPLAIVAKLKNIPIVTHEQTRQMGLATRLVARFAKKIAVGFPTEYYPKKYHFKTVFTGNPVRKFVLEVAKTHPHVSMAEEPLPTLLILGGSQGSKAINEVVLQALPKLLTQFRIIHQCGKSSHTHHYLEDAEKAVAKLEANLAERYQVVEFLDEYALAKAYSQANMVMSRAGANTITELAILQLPSLLVPLPWAANNEQFANAQWLVSLGLGEIIEQDQLTTEKLFEELEIVWQKPRIHPSHKAILDHDFFAKAAANIYQLVLSST